MPTAREVQDSDLLKYLTACGCQISTPADWANWEKELVNEKIFGKPKQISPQRIKYIPLHIPKV